MASGRVRGISLCIGLPRARIPGFSLGLCLSLCGKQRFDVPCERFIWVEEDVAGLPAALEHEHACRLGRKARQAFGVENPVFSAWLWMKTGQPHPASRAQRVRKARFPVQSFLCRQPCAQKHCADGPWPNELVAKLVELTFRGGLENDGVAESANAAFIDEKANADKHSEQNKLAYAAPRGRQGGTKINNLPHEYGEQQEYDNEQEVRKGGAFSSFRCC